MIKCYKLDGSESFKQLTGSTTVSDGVMTGGCGFITSDLIDNSKDWELRFDGAYSHASSAFDIFDSTIATRDRKCLKMALNGNFVEYNADGGYNEIKWTVPSINQYHKFILRKQNGTFTLTVDETTYSKASSYLSANSVNIAVGVDYWGRGSCSMKNIRYMYL